MSKRLLSASYSEINKMNSRQLLEAIALSEGRILAGECVSSVTPLFSDITNAEVISSLSADIVILNMFDVDHPYVAGLPEHEEKETIRLLKKLIGRPVGINLEATDLNKGNEELWSMTKGRLANAENARKALELGVDFIDITGNPGNHVTNEAIIDALKEIRAEVKDDMILIAGKMHASGSITQAGERIIDKDTIREFSQAGADVIMIPAPGTIPGISVEYAHELISYIHSLDRLAMTAIGTSQEGADTDTIKKIALNAKMAGADIHHIGDSLLLLKQNSQKNYIKNLFHI